MNGEVESEDEHEEKEDLGPIFDDEDESFGYPHQGPLLVARKGMIESIFDETDGRLVDGSDPAFDDESDPIYDDEPCFDYISSSWSSTCHKKNSECPTQKQ